MYYPYCNDCEWWLDLCNDEEPCTHPKFYMDIPMDNDECPLIDDGWHNTTEFKHRRKLGDQE